MKIFKIASKSIRMALHVHYNENSINMYFQMILIPFPDTKRRDFIFLYLSSKRKPIQEKNWFGKGLFCGIILVSSLADLCFP